MMMKGIKDIALGSLMEKVGGKSGNASSARCVYTTAFPPVDQLSW